MSLQLPLRIIATGLADDTLRDLVANLLHEVAGIHPIEWLPTGEDMLEALSIRGHALAILWLNPSVPSRSKESQAGKASDLALIRRIRANLSLPILVIHNRHARHTERELTDAGATIVTVLPFNPDTFRGKVGTVLVVAGRSRE